MPTVRTLRPEYAGSLSSSPDLYAPDAAYDAWGPDAWTALGKVHSTERSVPEAMAAYRAAAILAPGVPAALCNATYGCRDTDREYEAIAILRLVLRRDPELAQAWHNLASALRNVGQLDLACAAFRTALERWNDPMSHLGLGETLPRLGAADQAVRHLRTAIAALAPEDAQHHDAQFALGLALLSLGELEAGWAAYNARLHRPAFRSMAPEGLPEWTGPGDQHRNLFVWREQGIGDELRYLSCLADTLEDVDRVTVRSDPRLGPIIARSFGVEVVTGARQVPADVDCHVPVGRLPQYYRNDRAAFPGTPYLVADPERVAHWQNRLAALGPEPKVGFSWRSRLANNRRSQSYPDFDSLTTLADLAEVTLIDLQYATDVDELDRLRHAGVRIEHFPDLDLRDDIENVLALCAALDAVVSVGNAVAELSGAVGTTTFIIAPRFGAMALGATNSAWHRATTYITKAWDEPWTVALTDARHALTSTCLTSKEHA